MPYLIMPRAMGHNILEKDQRCGGKINYNVLGYIKKYRVFDNNIETMAMTMTTEQQ